MTASKPNGDGHWPLIIQGMVVLTVMTGGVWGLISNPIQKQFTDLTAAKDRNLTLITDLQQQLRAETDRVNAIFDARREEFVTQLEYKAESRRVADLLQVLKDNQIEAKKDNATAKADADKLRAEALTKADLQAALTTTRVEFLSEIKRLDEKIDTKTADRITASTFEAWKTERDVLIATIIKRLDSLEFAAGRSPR